MGVGALGYVGRGFDTVVLPALGRPLEETGCISCGQCVSVCPTGALQEHLPMKKQIPLETEETDTICGFCSMGCAQKTMTHGSLAVKAIPDPGGPVNAGVLCVNGRFGFSSACREEERISVPMLKVNGTVTGASYHDALVMTAKSMQSAARRYGSDAVAVAVSARFTTEEAYLAKKLADQLGAKIFSFSNRVCGLEPVLGLNASPNTMDELMGTEVILAVGFDAQANQVMRVKLMQAAKAGAQVVLINPVGYEQEHMEFAAKAVYTDNNPGFLKQVAKVLAETKTAASGKSPAQSAAEADAADLSSVADATVSDEAAEIAALYQNAKKAMIVFQQHVVSVSCAELIADIAVLSGHIGSPRDGIVMLKPKNNSQGLVQLGITAGAECLEGVKALLVLGENPDPEMVKNVEFLAVCDTHLTSLAREADVILPGTAPIHAEGSYINTERRFQMTHAALEPEAGFRNWQVICELAEALEMPFSCDAEDDIEREMADSLTWYREASEGEVIGGVLKPVKQVLTAVKDDVFAEPSANTDYLMDIIK